jgi:hypothetical protein
MSTRATKKELVKKAQGYNKTAVIKAPSSMKKITLVHQLESKGVKLPIPASGKGPVKQRKKPRVKRRLHVVF